MFLFLGQQDRVSGEPRPRPHRRLSLPRPPLPTGFCHSQICPMVEYAARSDMSQGRTCPKVEYVPRSDMCEL